MHRQSGTGSWPPDARLPAPGAGPGVDPTLRATTAVLPSRVRPHLSPRAEPSLQAAQSAKFKRLALCKLRGLEGAGPGRRRAGGPAGRAASGGPARTGARRPALRRPGRAGSRRRQRRPARSLHNGAGALPSAAGIAARARGKPLSCDLHKTKWLLGPARAPLPGAEHRAEDRPPPRRPARVPRRLRAAAAAAPGGRQARAHLGSGQAPASRR